MQYGTASGQYTGSANATFDTYTASQMCGGEAATTGYLFPGEWCKLLPNCTDADHAHASGCVCPNQGVSGAACPVVSSLLLRSQEYAATHALLSGASCLPS